MRIPEYSRSGLNLLLVAGLVLLAMPFALHAVHRGLLIGSEVEQATSRFIAPEAPVAAAALYAHMITGGLITVLAPLQLLTVVRRRWPGLHRLSGYVLAVSAGVTGLGGLWYILARGTIGGPVMDLGFGLYGGLMLLTASRTVLLARRRDPRHRLWAERLVILALASWFYRVHYGLWEIATGGAGTRPDFSGPFDQVQVFAFYLPYLAVHGWLRRQRS